MVYFIRYIFADEVEKLESCLLCLIVMDCVPSKIHMLKSNPKCDGICRWGLWEVIGS